MLSKKNRADKKTVERIFKKGSFSGSSNLSLKYIKDNTVKKYQISFIAPKGIAKRAVDRNRLRRRGYVVLKKYEALFPVGFSGVFIFSKNSLVIFGGRKNKINDPIFNLSNEIGLILKKIHLQK